MKHFTFLMAVLSIVSVSIPSRGEVIPSPDTAAASSCIRPDNVRAGDKVALVSPSYFFPMKEVEKAVEVLRSWGLNPVTGPNVGKKVDGQYAGTVRERLSDLRWALRDTSIKAVICIRGGYGTIHLIDSLQLDDKFFGKE